MSYTVSSVTKPENNKIYARQIAFVAAFILPTAKFLEAPSLLAKYAAGDLLLPTLLHFLLQAGILTALLIAASLSRSTISERISYAFGGFARIFYVLYAIYFLFSAILPLLDLEKFVYAAFFDTAPTTFGFALFFIVSAFLCCKDKNAIGRSADLCLFLFLIPFLALMVMSVSESDLTGLFPLFGEKFGDTMSAFTRTSPHFSDAVLLFPLIANLRYKKGDGVKILTGYGFGALFTLAFLAIFFGVYSSIASREHYAFSKIAQYFPALSVVGRIDLIFIYLLTVVLIFYTCLPLQYTTHLLQKTFGIESKMIIAAVLNFGLYLFVLFCNKYYNSFYRVISGKLPFVFWLIADMLPLFCLLLPKNTQPPNAKTAVTSPRKKELQHVSKSRS